MRDVGPSPLGPPVLNAAQQRVYDLLRVPEGGRPTFSSHLGDELRGQLEHELADVAVALPDGEDLWVAKRALANVHGCEARFLAERATPFEWTPATARGAIAHKAIELAVHWRGEAAPLDLVDEAMARLTEATTSLGDWLRTLTDADRAELRGLANERVVAFLECFPPLDRRWRPATESTSRVELCGGRVVLSGRTDLSLGWARGSEAGKVIVDLKSGGFSPAHRDDLRFYALVEAVKLGTPPRLVASFYLDAGAVHAEAVTDDVLAAALARTVAGIRRMVALTHHDHPPTVRPGTACRWCVARAGCDAGREFLARSEVEGLGEALDADDAR